MTVYYVNPYGLKTDNIRLRLFGLDIYRIPSKPMQPLLYPGNYVSQTNNKTQYSQEMKMITIPENHVFLLEDNRVNSSDSRMFGHIVNDEINAKASSILYCINNRSGNEIK